MTYQLLWSFFFNIVYLPVANLDQTFDYEVNDALMKYFVHCTKFVEDVIRNPSALSQVDKFKEGPEMRSVREKIANQLRVPYKNITAGQWFDFIDKMIRVLRFSCLFVFKTVIIMMS